MLAAIFIALVVVAVSTVAYLLTRPKHKKKAPDATSWIGPIGLVSPDLPPSARFNLDAAEVLSIVASMEAFTGKPITSVVVAFVDGLIPLDDGRYAAGVYHSADLWTHAWIELSGWPTTLGETAFTHELLHHASGLADTVGFRELLARFTAEKETQ